MKKVVIIFLFMLIFPLSISAKKVTVKFDSCVDGDTIKALIGGKKTTIRFLAVDTPESVHPNKDPEPYGKEASEYTCNKVKKAKKLEIEYDPNSSKTDKYERALGWIYVDDKLLQKELVSKGYAKVTYLYGKYLYTEELKEFETKAKEKKIGIWSIEEDNIDDDQNSTDTNKTFSDILKDEVTDYLKELVDDVFKKIKKTVKKKINNLFD